MNIAILRRNGLGDLLCAFPLVLFLQKKIPNSSITLFIDQRNAPLLPYVPSHLGHKAEIFPAHGNKYWNLFWTALRYRKKFDLAISAKTSPMKLNNLFLYWLKAKERIAYVDTSWHACLINHPIVYNLCDAQHLHQALRGLKTVAPHLETVPKELYPKLEVPIHIKRKYSTEMKKEPLILVSTTTTKFSNRFDVKRYASLLNRLHAATPISVRIISQQEDRSRAEALAGALCMTRQMHFPRNFDEFMVLLDTAEVFFVADGGVVHIGAALGKKIVALYGETNPVEWGPLSDQAEVFYHPVHVDHLPDDAIFEALKRKTKEVGCGRNNL